MTIEEIKAGVEKDPALKTALLSSFKDEFIKGATAEGLIIRTKADDQAFLDNHVKTVVDGKVATELQAKVDAEFSKAMNKIDEEIKTITGIEKQPNEKTTAYAKRAIAEKQKDPVTAAKVTELEGLIASTKKEYEDKLAAAEKDLFDREVKHQVTAFTGSMNIAIPAHIKTDVDKQAYVSQQRAMIEQGFLGTVTPKKDNEGNITFYEGDKPLLNTKDGKPKNAGDIISEKFAHWFIPKGQEGRGTGAASEGGTGAFKSADDVHKYLASQGKEAGSEEYFKEFEKLVTENKIAV